MPIRTLNKAASREQEPEYFDPIAREVGNRLREAQFWRNQDKLGNKSAETLLRNAYDQYHSIYDKCDVELVEATGIDLYPSLTAKKCRVLESFMRDLVVSDVQKLLTVRPTPIPELSSEGKAQAVAALRQHIATLTTPQTPEDYAEVARQYKSIQMQNEALLADKEARRQQKIIADKWVETKFVDEYMKFIHYLGRDPFAVMMGPILRTETVFQWSGNTMKEVTKNNHFVKAPDPRTYYYAPDCAGNGTGKCEIVLEKISKVKLLEAAELDGWIKVNIHRALQQQQRLDLEISRQSGGREDIKRYMASPSSTDTLTATRHFGLFSGKELRPYGLSVDEDKQYETMAITVNGYTVRLEVNVDPTAQTRRISTTSYHKEPDRILGHGIAQLVRPLERGFLAGLRGMMENFGYTSAPMGEVDYSRIARYMAPESIGKPLAGTVVPTDPDIVGGGRPAHYFHNIPNVTNMALQIMTKFELMADEHTGLPAALSGQPIGTGANRTFRGMINLQGNAMKIIQSAFLNIDRDVINPLVHSYHYVLRQDNKFKGDVRFEGSGVSGLLREELKKQSALENMQVMAQIAQSQQGQVQEGLIPWATGELMRASGVPDHIIDTPVAQPQQVVDQQ